MKKMIVLIVVISMLLLSCSSIKRSAYLPQIESMELGQWYFLAKDIWGDPNSRVMKVLDGWLIEGDTIYYLSDPSFRMEPHWIKSIYRE